VQQVDADESGRTGDRDQHDIDIVAPMLRVLEQRVSGPKWAMSVF